MARKSSQPEKKAEAHYSPFWPMALVLLVLILLSALDLHGALLQRAGIRQTLLQAQPTLEKAQVVKNTLNRLSRDLLLLSPKNPEAKKIVQEFGIQAIVQTHSPDNSRTK
ncbi:MAG: hypothetical protein PHD76_13445 [Methylacidiphilales bacterium]|nr:hypothetical protein [Candidatus Methylacidiphilales bacterium]